MSANTHVSCVHIRQLGEWTLKRVFSEACEDPVAGKSGLLKADETTKKSLPKLLIDGPYGAPAQDYRKYDVLLLVGDFYCGAPVLAKELNQLCHDYNQKGSTKFEFHKEHF